MSFICMRTIVRFSLFSCLVAVFIACPGRPVIAQDAVGQWCAAAGPGNEACVSDPVAACSAQHDYYAPENPFEIGYYRSNYIYQCDWCTHLDIPRCNLHPLPSTAVFRCPSNLGSTPPEDWISRVPGPRCVRAKDMVNEGRVTRASVKDGTSNPSTCNPTILQTGSRVLSADDFATADGRLFIRRAYRSISSANITSGAFAAVSDLGSKWRTNFFSRLELYSTFSSSGAANKKLTLTLPDGTSFDLAVSTGTATANGYKLEFVGALPSDLGTIVANGGQWKLTDPDGQVTILDLYKDTPTTYRYGRPSQITAQDGYAQALTYGSGGGLSQVTDSLGRQLIFTWNNFSDGSSTADRNVASIALPDGTSLKYMYDTAGVTNPDLPGGNRLIKAERRTSSNVLLQYTTYLYENSDYPYAVTGIIDGRGIRYATYGYDTSGRSISSDHAGQDTTTITYGEDGTQALRTVTNALGKNTEYRFKRSTTTNKTIGNLLSITGQASANCPTSTHVYTYDANNFVATDTDEEGRITKYTRDTSGRATQVVRGFGTPEAATTAITWHSTFNVPAFVDQGGLHLQYNWNTSGQLSGIIAQDTTSHTVPYSTNGQIRNVSFSYTTSGLLLTVNGPLAGTGDTTTYTYDANGYVATITDPVGLVTTINTVDGAGRPTQVTDPNGVVTNLAYDGVGRLISMIVDPGPSQAQTSFGWDGADQLTSITRPDASTLTFTYDNARRLTGVSNGAGESIAYVRDLMGNATNIKVKAGSTIVAERNQAFDELGRLLRVVGVTTAQTWGFSYDKVDNLVGVTDPRSKVWSGAFDALNRLVSETDPTSATVTLTRNAQDDVTSYKDPRLLTTSYVRNGFGEAIRIASPDTGNTDLFYDSRGLPTQVTDARGIVTTMNYDNAGRVLTRSYPAASSENVSFTYDSVAGGNFGKGRLTSDTDATGSAAYTYDKRGNLLTESRVIGAIAYPTSYSYDLANRVATITYPSGRIVTYARDAMGRITGVTTKENAGASTVMLVSGVTWQAMAGTSDLLSAVGLGASAGMNAGTAAQLRSLPDLAAMGGIDLLKGLTFGNGLVLTKTFSQDNELTRIKLADGATSIIDRTYSRPDKLNIGQVSDAVMSGDSELFTFSDANRLATASGSYGTRSWLYDGVGNRISETIGGTTTNWTYPGTSNLLSTVKQGATTQRAFTHDAAGNITQDVRGATTYAYGIDNAGRIATLTVGGTPRATYTYDAFERLRVRALTSGIPTGTTHLIWDASGHVIAEHATGGAVGREYVWLGDVPIAAFDATTSPTQLRFVHTDQLDRPARMTDGTKATIWSAKYEPFGGVSAVTGTASIDLSLPGQWFQLESGLAYNWHRSYDPSTGRYTQPDPLGFVDGPSLYGYAGQSPGINVDPTGLASLAGGMSFRPTSNALLCSGDGCAEEWDRARAMCLSFLLTPNPPRGITGGYRTIEQCAKGLVSERCGGNPVSR